MYYFSNYETGDDDNVGNFDAPFKKGQKALDVAIAGDTVYLRQAVYPEKLTFPRSGADGAAIKLSGYPGEFPTIDAHELHVPGGDGILAAREKSFIEIEYLRLINSKFAALWANDCQGIHSRHLKTYNTRESAFMILDSQDIEVSNSDLELAAVAGGNAFVVLRNVNGFEVANNHIHRAVGGVHGGEGITIMYGSRNGKLYRNHIHNIRTNGIYLDAWDEDLQDVEVYQNLIHDVPASGMAIGAERGGTVGNVKYHHNTVFGVGCVGIVVWGKTVMGPISIDHNFVFNNGGHDRNLCNPGWQGGIMNANPKAKDVDIVHNIVSQNKEWQIRMNKNATANVDDNLIDGFRGYPGETKGTNPTEGDVEFLLTAMKARFAGDDILR